MGHNKKEKENLFHKKKNKEVPVKAKAFHRHLHVKDYYLEMTSFAL